MRGEEEIVGISFPGNLSSQGEIQLLEHENFHRNIKYRKHRECRIEIWKYENRGSTYILPEFLRAEYRNRNAKIPKERSEALPSLCDWFVEREDGKGLYNGGRGSDLWLGSFLLVRTLL